MRRTTHLFSLAPRMARSLVLLLLCSLVMAPVAALAQTPADEPTGDDQPTVYLPLINKTNANTDGNDSTEVMITGSFYADETPIFPPAPPKEVTVADPLPQGPEPKPEPSSKPVPGDNDVNPAATEGWTTILNDGFETIPWPFAGWQVYDASGTTDGVYYWDDEDFRPYRGQWSGWPAANALDPAFSNYAPNMRTWMIYGPFSLADASRATMTFQYWSQTELNYDWMGWFASPDGSQFFGNWVSGDSNGWRPGVIDFSAVPGYGSMLGDSTVWIGFYFYSDATTQLKGPFIDDIFIQKFNCPGQFTAFWYNALVETPQTLRAVTCESWPFARNWGAGSPIWLPNDNWMLRLVGTPFFNPAGNYTFNARSDDGVRVTVDGSLIIDKWFDQGATQTWSAVKNLSASTHTVVVDYYDRTGNAQLNVGWQP